MNRSAIRRPGGIFRIKQATLERDALGWRQLFEDSRPCLLHRGFQAIRRVVGFRVRGTPSATVSGLSSSRILLADGVVDFVERPKNPKVRAPVQLDELDTVIGFERGDQIAKVGSLQFRDNCPQQWRVFGLLRSEFQTAIMHAEISHLVAHPGRRSEHRRRSRRGNGGIRMDIIRPSNSPVPTSHKPKAPLLRQLSRNCMRRDLGRS